MISVNEKPVFSGCIRLPLQRTWSAVLEMQQDILSIGEAVTVSSGTRTFAGTVFTKWKKDTTELITLVGGAGKLGERVQAKHFKSTFDTRVAEYSCNKAGEVFSEKTYSKKRLTRFSVPNLDLGRVLDLLSVWYIDYDGSLVLGSPDRGELIGESLNRTYYGEYLFNTSNELKIVPGMSFGGKTIKNVLYELSNNKTTCKVRL